MIALSALTLEADREAAAGDYRKALLGELFACRMASAHTRRAAVLEAWEGLPDLYPVLCREEPLAEPDYRAAVACLSPGLSSLVPQSPRGLAGVGT